MTVWFTSDTHLRHKLVAKIRFRRLQPQGDFPEDIDLLLKWHDELLAANWDAKVKKDDQVWVLGDLCLGGRAVLDYTLDWFSERPGDCHLILGNHDKAHPVERDSHKWVAHYLRERPKTKRVPFHSVQLAAKRKVILSTEEPRYVMLSHMPYTGDREGPDRETQWRLRDEGSWLFHGHLHGSKAFHTPGTRQIDVGMDPWGLAPVSLEELTSLMFYAEKVVGVG